MIRRLTSSTLTAGTASAVILALLSLAASGCVGFGRNRSDEFDARLSRGMHDDYDDHDFDREERWDPEPAPRQESLVEHRSRPVVDPGARRGDIGPLVYLNALHAELADRPVEGYALMWEDARVFSSERLDEGSSLGRLGYRPDHWRASGGQVVPVRVIADHGRAIEIETLSRKEARGHCDGGVRRAMDAYRVRMYVPRAELVPVVASEIQREFEDGSVAFVPPGVAVRPTDEGIVARLAGGAIEVPVPEEVHQLGLSYTEVGFELERLSPEPMSEHLEPRSPLLLAGMQIQLRMLPGDAGRPRWVRPADTGSRVFMGDRCVAVVLVTDDPDPVGGEMVGGFGLSGIGGGGGGADYNYEVRAGATAWWAPGERAGVTRSRAQHSQEPEQVGELLCFTFVGVVKVCHERADVRMIDQTEVRGVTGVVEEDAEGWVEEDDMEMVEESKGVWVIEEQD